MPHSRKTGLPIRAHANWTANGAPTSIIAKTGIEPAYVRCDNGPEFTAGALNDWCVTAGVETAFIDPGSPWQNGFIESFNAQFRREQLAGEIIDTMTEAQYLAIDNWT